MAKRFFLSSSNSSVEKKLLHAAFVQGRPDPAHRLDDPELGAQALEQVGGVLAAPVGVEDHTFDVAAPDGHGLARRFRFRSSAERSRR